MFDLETARLKAAIDAYGASHLLADNTIDPRQLAIMQENIEAVRQAEWELFYTLSGAKLANLAWSAFRAWRAAGVAATGSAVIGRLSLGDKGLSSMRQMIVNDKLWNSLSKAEQWGLNRQWLDTVIKGGQDVVLATRNFAADSWTAQEVKYLLSKGYQWAADGTKLIPK